MSPNLFLYPVSDKRKAFTRIAQGKIVHPTTKDRVDLLDHPLQRLAVILSEDLLQLCHQCRPFLQLRRVVRSPLPVTTQNATIFKAQESETSSVCQIDDFALLFVYLHFEFHQFHSQSLFHRPCQPDMLRMGVDQYHHVIRKSCVLNTGIWLLSGGLNRLLQHPIYLIEIEVTEQRRNHSPYTKGNFEFERVVRGWRASRPVLDLRLKR